MRDIERVNKRYCPKIEALSPMKLDSSFVLIAGREAAQEPLTIEMNTDFGDARQF